MWLIGPPDENMMLKTIPNAIELVTYGKKKTVWKNAFNPLIELIHTASNKDTTIVNGTLTTTIKTVFKSEFKNVGSVKTEI